MLRWCIPTSSPSLALLLRRGADAISATKVGDMSIPSPSVKSTSCSTSVSNCSPRDSDNVWKSSSVNHMKMRLFACGSPSWGTFCLNTKASGSDSKLLNNELAHDFFWEGRNFPEITDLRGIRSCRKMVSDKQNPESNSAWLIVRTYIVRKPPKCIESFTSRTNSWEVSKMLSSQDSRSRAITFCKAVFVDSSAPCFFPGRPQPMSKAVRFSSSHFPTCAKILLSSRTSFNRQSGTTRSTYPDASNTKVLRPDEISS
mmetsp:Transcript_78165/g.226743  ORF Transcript_78165/g.226743 Transcript_78165/m.226743 type:complete len:257 (-) Transcript_78165:1688-2458(-)